MNCPSRVDADAIPNGWNQSPDPLSLETNQGLNGIANLRSYSDHRIQQDLIFSVDTDDNDHSSEPEKGRYKGQSDRCRDENHDYGLRPKVSDDLMRTDGFEKCCLPSRVIEYARSAMSSVQRPLQVMKGYAKFVGPGFMISVAYIDPGNYATDIAAGASYKFRLLFMILLSNIIAIFLQSLCIKLGSVTGLDLAENIKVHCPRWLNYMLWFFAEVAIIVTDIAEVIGTAIALNLLFHVPVVAGCAISIIDVLFILLFYRTTGSMRGVRIFECFVAALVLGVVVCFCIELSLINVSNIGSLFKGYLPSSAVVESKGLYQACGILGATVMPHSLYLGSGLVQPRLQEYDTKYGNIPDNINDEQSEKYRPSIAAIRACMKYATFELGISLFTFALFVNSAILIIAGAALSDTPGAANANLFVIHDLLSSTLAPAAGTVFALALLLSGTSAGIVCTIAGQMVTQGQLDLKVKPWLQRLMTRSVSITPSIIIAGAVGKDGLSAALEASQVALSVILPFVSAPLIYFTCRNKFMTARDSNSPDGIKMRNHWIVALFAGLLWLLITIMNIAALVLVGIGNN